MRTKIRLVNVKLKSKISESISCEITYKWMSQDVTDDELALVHVMAWSLC